MSRPEIKSQAGHIEVGINRTRQVVPGRTGEARDLKIVAEKQASNVLTTFGSQLMKRDLHATKPGPGGNTGNSPDPTFSGNGKGIRVKDDGGTGPGDEHP